MSFDFLLGPRQSDLVDETAKKGGSRAAALQQKRNCQADAAHAHLKIVGKWVSFRLSGRSPN